MDVESNAKGRKVSASRPTTPWPNCAVQFSARSEAEREARAGDGGLGAVLKIKSVATIERAVVDRLQRFVERVMAESESCTLHQDRYNRCANPYVSGALPCG